LARQRHADPHRASGWTLAAILCACSGSLRTSAEGGTDAGRSDARADAPPADTSTKPDSGGALANGTLGAWTTLSPMPLPRANHCAVTAAGYLVVLGGNNQPEDGGAFVRIDAVDVAALNGDGTVGPWSSAGTTPSPVYECTATASGSTIYLVDGIYEDMSDQGHMFSAELSPAGKLGAWKQLGPLPNGQDAFYSSAWIANDAHSTLYAMDARLPMKGDGIAALHVATSPKLGAWSEDNWLPGFLGHPQYAFTGSYVYTLGGYESDDAGNPVVATVSGAPIEADGSVGAPFTTEPLPTPIAFGEAMAVDDWIFQVGGQASAFGTGVAGAFSAPVGTDGKLGTWKAQPSLPEGRTSLTLTLAGDFLYVTGGGYLGSGLPTVFSARVRF
jgi:Kelch motif